VPYFRSFWGLPERIRIFFASFNHFFQLKLSALKSDQARSKSVSVGPLQRRDSQEIYSCGKANAHDQPAQANFTSRERFFSALRKHKGWKETAKRTASTPEGLKEGQHSREKAK